MRRCLQRFDWWCTLFCICTEWDLNRNRIEIPVDGLLWNAALFVAFHVEAPVYVRLHLNILHLHVPLSSFHAGLWPGDLSEPDGQHSHRAAQTRPKQRRPCKVGFTNAASDKHVRKYFRSRKSTHQVVVNINTRQWGSIAREFGALLHVSHFWSSIYLWAVILWRRTAFEDEITKALCYWGGLQHSFS